MDLLFKNITAITMDETFENGALERMLNNTVRKNVCVGITGGKISYVGEFHDGLTAKRVVDGTDKVLIPGLYNCHTHTPMSLLRGYSNDVDLQDWLYNYIFPAEAKFTKEMPYIGAMVAIAEMISSGTIAFTDMYFGLPEIARAAAEVGVKACLTNAVVAFDPVNFDLKKDKSYIETFEVLKGYHKDSNGLIKANAGIHGEYTSFDGAWLQTVEFAKENKLDLQLHLSETKFEHEQCKKKYGLTPAQILDKHGVFSVPATAAHCVWVEDCDIEIFAKRGVTVAHNPISNLKLASGIAPIKAMLDKGVNVALGTDGMASNNSHDLFEEIKMASLLQKASCLDPKVVPAYEALKFATLNGAKAQGRDGGAIKQGLDADLVMLDFSNVRQTICHNHLANAVYSTTGRDVELTMCRGKILYENGEFTTLDIEKVLFEARKCATVFNS